MEVICFTDGGTRYETWDLPNTGWDGWAANVDRFIAHAVRGIADAYVENVVEWLEINFWQDSGRLIVFPSSDGPGGDRDERVCYELASAYLKDIFESVPESDQDRAWDASASRVWHRISECLTAGEAASQLSAARRSHKLRIAGYDYNSGEGPLRIGQNGVLA